MVLEFLERVVLTANHTDATNVIQMLGRESAVVVENLEMKFQVFLALAVTKKAAEVALDANQGFWVTGKVFDILVIQVVIILAMVLPQVVLYGRQVRLVMETSSVAKSTDEGHFQMALSHMLVHMTLRFQLLAAKHAVLLQVNFHRFGFDTRRPRGSFR